MIKTLKKMVVERSAESQDSMANGTDEGPSEKNIFKVEIMAGRREKKMNPVEEKLNQWLTANLEEKESTKVNATQLYEHYLESCIASSEPGADAYIFARNLKTLFPKGYTTRQDSPIHGILKERKVQPKPTVQAESLKLKMKDIITQTLEELGNPNKGIHHQVIKRILSAKYPALRLDLKPNMLKNALMLGYRHGYFELVRGIGACGAYRIAGKPSTVEEPEDKKKKKKKDIGEVEAEGEEAGGEGEGEGGEEGEKKKKKASKRKSGEGEEEEAKEEGEGEAAAEGEPKKKRKRKGTKKHKRKHIIIHSAPKKMEDVFPLAFTYNNEPKEASVAKIRNYMQKYYPDVNVDTTLKKQLDNGLEKGYWSLARGSASTGTFRLEIDEFDPTDDEDLIGKIINAIMAGSDPKVSSAILLKKYLVEYHPEFKVEQRPHLYAKALERAINNNIIRRLTGIGSTGSFQLVERFVPSPAALAGEDTESDYEEEYLEGDKGEVVDTPKGRTQLFTLEMFQDNYKPRPSKSRGHGRQAMSTVRYMYDEEPKPKPTQGYVRKPPTARKEPKKPATKAAKKEIPPTKGKGGRKAKAQDAKPQSPRAGQPRKPKAKSKRRK